MGGLSDPSRVWLCQPYLYFLSKLREILVRPPTTSDVIGEFEAYLDTLPVGFVWYSGWCYSRTNFGILSYTIGAGRLDDLSIRHSLQSAKSMMEIHLLNLLLRLNARHRGRLRSKLCYYEPKARRDSRDRAALNATCPAERSFSASGANGTWGIKDGYATAIVWKG